jgi:hypothetical protein
MKPAVLPQQRDKHRFTSDAVKSLPADPSDDELRLVQARKRPTAK